MASQFASGKIPTLTRKLNAGDSTAYFDSDVGVTSGRLYGNNNLQEEWIGFTGVAASGSEFAYSGLTRGLSQTADPSTASTGFTWLSGQSFALVEMHDQMYNKQRPEPVIFATTAARDTALGADGAAASPWSNVYVTATGLHYNYNLSTAQWESIDTGTVTPNASTTVAGKIEIGTQTEVDAGTDTGGTGAYVSVIPSTFQAGIINRMATSSEGASQTKVLNPYMAGILAGFGGTGADGAVDGTAGITLAGSNDTFIEKDYTSWAAGTAPRTFTVTPTGCITRIRIAGNADFTNWTFDLDSKGTAGGAIVSTSKANGNAGSTSFMGSTGGQGGTFVAATGAGGAGSGASSSSNGTAGGAGTAGVVGAGGVEVKPLATQNIIRFLKGQRIDVGTGGASGALYNDVAQDSGVGGAGGGTIIFEIAGNVTFGSCTFNARGGAGGNGTGSSAGGGAGGGGGTVVVIYSGTKAGTYTANVTGGAGGTGGANIGTAATGTTGIAYDFNRNTI